MITDAMFVQRSASTTHAICALLTSLSRGSLGGIACFVILFLFTIGPVLQFGGIQLDLPKFLLVCMAMGGVLVAVARGKVDSGFSALVLALALSYVYLVGICAVYGFRDLLMVKVLLWGFAMAFASLWLAHAYSRRYGSEFVDVLLWHLFLVGVIHALIMVVAFLVADFREWLYSFIVLNEKGQRFVEFNFRAPGLTSSGGAKLSLFQALTFLCGVAAATSAKNRTRGRQIAVVLSLPLILTSIMLSGRTGLLILVLSAASWIAIRTAMFLVGARISLRAAALMCVGFSCVAALIPWAAQSELFDGVVKRAFEFYFVWQRTGSLGTDSTDVLFERMYFFPDNPIAMAFGTSNFGRGDDLPYIASDVGYVRFIFGAGIVGTLIAFSHYAAILWFSIKSRRGDSRVRAVVVFLVGVAIIVNFKELLFVDIHGWTSMLFLLFCALRLSHTNVDTNGRHVDSLGLAARVVQG